MKIAVWSGPRNLSTALMYAFGNRSDFSAWDEPFYAAYLRETGIDHPMREDVLTANETDAARIGQYCAGPVPDGKPHWYMKHMSFHMCEGFPLEWAQDCVNIHLIRHPARVITSYVAKREEPTLTDIGYAKQVEVYEQLPGPIIDSADIRETPKRALQTLCDHIGLAFDPAMLSWPLGPKPFDGVWAPHWYTAVHRSTGFAGPEGPLPVLDGTAAQLAEKAMPHYLLLKEKALKI